MDKTVKLALRVRLMIRRKRQAVAVLNVMQPVVLVPNMAGVVLVVLKAIQEATLLNFKV
jgi:hypothetical protein